MANVWAVQFYCINIYQGARDAHRLIQEQLFSAVKPFPFHPALQQ